MTCDLGGEPPEETFDLVRRLGGVAAEQEARSRYAGKWGAIPKEQLVDTIGKIAKRALRDPLKELIHISAISRLHLGRISATPRLHLGHVSAGAPSGTR